MILSRKFLGASIVGVIFVIMVSSISYAGNWHLWHKAQGIAFYLKYSPQRGSHYPYYALVIYNTSGSKKLIHFLPVLHVNGKITSYLSTNKGVDFVLYPGKKTSVIKFYIQNDPYYMKTHRPPSFGFKSYYIK